MAITSNSSTVLNQYVPPFKLKGELLKNQVLIYDSACQSFVNVDAVTLVRLANLSTSTIVESVQLFDEVADGQKSAFIIPWPAVSKDSLIVTTDGIRQNDYTVNVYNDVSTITFPSVIAANVQVEVQGFQVLTPRKILKFSSDITVATTVLTMPWVVNAEKSALVFIDGVKQHQGSFNFTYAASNSTTITFTELVPVNSKVEVIGLYGFDPNSFRFAQYVGDGSTSTYALSWAVDSYASLFVSIDGVKQQTGAYTFTNTGANSANIVFSSNVPLNSEIEITGFTAFNELTTAVDTLVIGNNLGTGHTVFNSSVQIGDQTKLSFRSIVAGSGIVVSSNSSEITISTESADHTYINLGTGLDIFKEVASNEVRFKTLVAGDGITLTDSANSITLSVDIDTVGLNPANFAQTITSVGTGTDLVKKASAASNSTFQLYSLKAGTGIVVTRVGDEVIIADANGGNYSQVTSNYTVKLDDSVVGVADTSVQRFVVLTSASLAGEGKTVVIKDETGLAATNNIIVSAPTGSTIDGVASYTITDNYGSARFYCNGTNWFII